MKHLKSAACFMFMLLALITAGAEAQNTPNTHIVKKGETLYHIAQTYNISVDDLLKANPGLSADKYFVGMYLNIPVAPARTVMEADIMGTGDYTTKVPNRVQVAVVLPFTSNAVSALERRKMIEYYRGFLMSVDSLKQQGVSVDVYTYDSGDKTNASIENILKEPVLKSMNLIIGPALPSQIAPIAAFAKQNRIRMVVPFSSKCQEVYNNQYVYMVKSPQKYVNDDVYGYFAKQFGNEHIVFYETYEQNSKEVDFVAGLKNYLTAHGIAFSNISKNSDNVSIVNQLNIAHKNIIIPNSASINALNVLMPKLKDFTQENPAYDISLFGYPDWQTYHKTHLNNFYNYDTYIWSLFYCNAFGARTKAFDNTYYRWFGQETIEAFPRFGMLGFDTGYYFLFNLNRYGNEFEKNCNAVEMNPYQSDFRYKRMNSEGGYINTSVLFLHYLKAERRLIKINQN